MPITCSAKATFSETVLFGSSRKSWKTVPIWRRSAGTFQLRSRLSSLPATKTWPCVARASRSTSRRNVDLPGAGLTDQEDELALVDVGGHVLSAGLVWPG